jgi:Holliday junction DNA helicase RuvA
VLATSKFLNSVAVGDSVIVRIFHVFKQEQQILCGFQTNEELNLFKILLAVPNIGTKTAMLILSVLSLEELATAIATQDSDAFLRVAGIGKKTAARILLELKDKILKLDVSDTEIKHSESSHVNDAILGLVSLGYQKHEVVRAINKIVPKMPSGSTSNEIVIKCLKEL